MVLVIAVAAVCMIWYPFFVYSYMAVIYHNRDPQDDVPFAEVLYTNDAYLKSLYNALSDDGVIVLQLGLAPFNDDPDEAMTMSRRRAYLISSMERAGFESLHVYEEMHCDFEGEHCFLNGI